MFVIVLKIEGHPCYHKWQDFIFYGGLIFHCIYVLPLLFFCTNEFIFCLIPSPFSPSPTTLPSDSCQSVFCICVSRLLVYFVHQISHMSEIIWCLSFSNWFISLSIILSRSIHAVTKGKISFFFFFFFFLQPSSSPLCKCTTYSLSICLLMDS